MKQRILTPTELGVSPSLPFQRSLVCPRACLAYPRTCFPKSFTKAKCVVSCPQKGLIPQRSGGMYQAAWSVPQRSLGSRPTESGVSPWVGLSPWAGCSVSQGGATEPGMVLSSLLSRACSATSLTLLAGMPLSLLAQELACPRASQELACCVPKSPPRAQSVGWKAKGAVVMSGVVGWSWRKGWIRPAGSWLACDLQSERLQWASPLQEWGLLNCCE
jgi:hypothetical protein